MTPISWQRVGELERKSLNLRRVLVLLIAGPGILNLFFGINFSLLFISACLALAGRLFRYLQTVSMDLKNLTQGLAAEEQVFQWLELLPCDWSVERRIEVDNADIDLLVTTPQGVTVAIEIKSHEGEIRLLDNKLIRKGNYDLDGDFISILKKRASKLALRRGLPSIACVIVFTRANLRVPQASVDGVFVRDLMELIPLLHKIDTQTRKFNAIRSINQNQELVEVVAEEEESYEPVLNCNPEPVSLEILMKDIGFNVSHDYRAKLHQCFRCKEWIVVFTWSEHEMWSEAMPPKPIPRSIKYRYSKSLQRKYWVNTCQKCGATQGDSFVHQGQKNDQETWKFIYNSAPIYFKG